MRGMATKQPPPKAQSKSAQSKSALSALTKDNWATLGDDSEKLIGKFNLRKTDVPGVFRNQDGALVNESNVLMSLRQVQAAEQDRALEVLGEEVSSPAMLLKRVALDPTLPLSMRLSAAVSAAPYYDRKMPVAIEGGDPDKPMRTETKLTLSRLNGLEPAERKLALDLLEKLGLLGTPKSEVLGSSAES